jgi:hypothetical protein
VREQMTHRGTGRARFGVEFDGALLDGDLCRAGHQGLGHRRQGEAVTIVAVSGQHARRPDHRGGDVGDRPIGDCLQRAHFRAT